MGFWEVLETLVGHSQEAGLIKESVAAIFAEAEGKDESIKELATDAAVSIAIDSVMAAKLGRACEAAIRGKTEIEAAIASIEKGEATAATKDAFEAATQQGFSPLAAKAIAATGTVLAMPPMVHVVAAKGLGDDPKRGHHVINNGLRKVFGKMLGDFVKKNSGYFQCISVLEKLIARVGITNESIISMSRNQPFGAPYDEFIEKTTVYTPKGKTHNDPNEKEYGESMNAFRTHLCVYMTALFLGLADEKIKPSQLFGYAEDDGKAANNIVVKIIDKNVFVDEQALGWWLDEHKGKKRQEAKLKYDQAHAAVVDLFSRFKYTAESLCFPMAIVFFNAYKKLNKQSSMQ